MHLMRPINTSLCLAQLCESNYQKLFCLIPNLRTLGAHATSKTPNKPPLHLTIIERSKHTITAVLSHRFKQKLSGLVAPEVTIRIYLDLNTAEVVHGRAGNDETKAGTGEAAKTGNNSVDLMNRKWRLNYFLQKWLDYRLQNHAQKPVHNSKLPYSSSLKPASFPSRSSFL